MIADDPMRRVEDARAAMQGVLDRLVGADAATLADVAAGLAPRPTDFDEVFVPAAAGPMRAWFDRVYAAHPVPAPGPGQTTTRLHVALAGLLGADNPFSRPFPGGYRKVAPALMPLVPWGCWTFRAYDDDAGLSYDGLVWVHGRVIWLPKPWRAAAR